MAEMLNLSDGVEKVAQRARELLARQPSVVIGIAGGTASGKGVFGRMLSERIDAKILNMDDYFIGKTRMMVFQKELNFDCPEAIDLGMLGRHIRMLKAGRTVDKPVYGWESIEREGSEPFESGQVLIVDGLFALHDMLRNQMDIRVFVDAPEELRLERRLKRDVAERGKTEEWTMNLWNKFVKPGHDMHVEPTKKHADFVIANRDYDKSLDSLNRTG